MTLPLPRVVPDVGPGGPLVTAMRGGNALADELLQTHIRKIQAQYAPLTTQAEAASKLTYANLMGPQFLAKLMGNSDVVANSPQLQDPRTMAMLYQAGTGGGGNALLNNSALSGMFSQSPRGDGLFSRLMNWLTGGNSQPQMQQPNGAPATQSNPLTSPNQQRGANTGYALDQQGQNVRSSPQEVAQIAAQGNNAFNQPVPGQNNPLTMPASTGGNSYYEKAGKAAGIKEEGKELGKSRAEAISDLGKQQLDLSNSGVILDRLVNITQNPEFQNMRNQIPYFQDKQLWYLSKNGTPAQQKMIGDLISTAEAFKASTVNSFRGKALEKEFNLADKIKINENDTMGVIQGKLTSLKTLKDIAETKNDMILSLMTDEHMNLGDATKKANKLVNTSAIEKQVEGLLNPQPSEHDIQYMMKKRNLSREEIINQLKARGYKNVS